MTDDRLQQVLDANFIDNILEASKPCLICGKLTMAPESVCGECLQIGEK